MKLNCLIIFLLSFCTYSAQDVDGLKTDIQVEMFFKSSELFNHFYVVPISELYRDPQNQHIADSLNVKTWVKADFNNDNKTDLIVYGVWNGRNSLLSYVSGLNHGTFQVITRSISDYICFPTVIEVNGQIVLINPVGKEFYRNEIPEIMPDTLIYKFGTFIEFNSSPSYLQFENLVLSSLGTIEDSSTYSIAIYSDKSAKYRTFKSDNKLSNSGIIHKRDSYEYIGTVDTCFNKFNELVALINYLNLPKAKDVYSSFDDYEITYQFTYRYNQVQTKTITFQYDDATRGLQELFNRIDGMKEDMFIWKKNQAKENLINDLNCT